MSVDIKAVTNPIYKRIKEGNKIDFAQNYKKDILSLMELIIELEQENETLLYNKDTSKENLLEFIGELNKLLRKHGLAYPIPC